MLHACGEKRNARWVLVGEICRNRQLEDVDVDWRIIFKWNISRIGFIWIRIGASGGLF
jgi:hypothetical protein